MVGNIILQASLYYTFDYNMLSVDNEDPLLLVEWDEVGLVARSVANQAHTKILLVNNILVGYAPFPSVTNPSDCAFGFVDTAGLPAKQAMTNAVGALVTYVNSANEIPKKGQYDATEVTYVFS
ncbi:21355_t:CDS:2 [Rhizophagus irregularis]|nr:21355_t:CDS:2 [Rhizophagus irregularis]